MPITMEQIVEETRHWTPEKVGELMGRLTEELHATEPEIAAAWKTEIDRRVERHDVDRQHRALALFNDPERRRSQRHADLAADHTRHLFKAYDGSTEIGHANSRRQFQGNVRYQTSRCR